MVKSRKFNRIASNSGGGAKSNRVAIYIDFPNVWARSNSRGKKVDLDLIRLIANLHGEVVSSKVYLTIRVDEKVNEKILNFERKGFRVVSRLVPKTDFGEKKDIDTYLLTDLLVDTFTLGIDTLIVVSDDSDYAPAIAKALEHGKEVISVVSSIQNAKIIAFASSDYYELAEIEVIEDELRKDDIVLGNTLETFAIENRTFSDITV